MSQAELGPPKVSPVLQFICKSFLTVNGWKISGQYPPHPKAVVIFAPHTSNWDFVYIMCTMYALGCKPNWLGKKEMFFWPAKYLFMGLGGIPVDRNGSLKLVDQTAQAITDREQAILGIAPEGTRSKSKYWKSGFYHIAEKAGVPVNFAYLDYAHKTGGVQEGFVPSGDVEADMEIVREFFAEKGQNGKYPENIGEITLKPRPKQLQGTD
jgi:1-acyl-sn-glycerol-3-phosphate acyltransferase